MAECETSARCRLWRSDGWAVAPRIADAAHIGAVSVYVMRMARVNITLPDGLLSQARAAGLNISRLAAAALAEELDRRAKINELDAYLADLDNELGPVPQHELKAAREWADATLPAGRDGTGQARSA